MKLQTTDKKRAGHPYWAAVARWFKRAPKYTPRVERWRLGRYVSAYMPHQGIEEAARRVRQGKAGTGGPLHRMINAIGFPHEEYGDLCRCRECIAPHVAEKRAANEGRQI